MYALPQAIAWDKTDEGHFQGQITPEWAQGRAAFGGLLTSAAIKAMEATCQHPERRVRSALTSFIAPVGPGAVQLQLQVLREGRSVSHMEARIQQGDKLCAVILAGLGASRSTRVRIPPPPRPEAPGPEGLSAMPFLPGLTPNFTQHFEYRWTGKGLPFSGHEEAHVQGWIRPRGEGAVDNAIMPSLMDAWPPPVWSIAESPVPGSTLTWQANMMADINDKGWTCEDWWFHEARSHVSDEGYSDMVSRLWSPDGKLAATSRQLFADFSGAPLT